MQHNNSTLLYRKRDRESFLPTYLYLLENINYSISYEMVPYVPMRYQIRSLLIYY